MYDLSQALLPQENDEEPELDIDGVRHVPLEEYQGPPVQDVRLWTGEAVESSSSESDPLWESSAATTTDFPSEDASLMVASTGGVADESVSVGGCGRSVIECVLSRSRWGTNCGVWRTRVEG